ncbi:hypothetical protein LTR78_004561 [Recurvomyces mirabilis]|uniref:Uncharacterized protein n=1 Tax=Recurvomyces mirabilis TaxID=574656 RepID=A0AAE0WPB6_9PEZI|nr:hypothetical protein LTR78_004561 [Recurvomyces mirabilis]KAK5152945.1 hypothetical protein LTS14_008053 [Recurvomyces mirabilis]
MGFSSFWTTIVGTKVKEITPQHRPFSFEEGYQAAATAPLNPLHQNRAAAISEVILPPRNQDAQSIKSKRKSRSFSMSKHKADGQTIKRRSWFGGKPEEEAVPAVPKLPPFTALPPMPISTLRPEAEDIRPGTALTVDDQIELDTPKTPKLGEPKAEKRKSRRLSLGQALKGRTRSKSTASQAAPTLEKRQSVLGGLRDMAPPVPALPVASPPPELIDEDTGMVPSALVVAEKRKSRRFSLSRALTVERRKSTASTKSSRRSWWQSSNPDDGESSPPPVPAVPALIQDDGMRTPDSSIAYTASPDNSDLIESNPFSDGPMRTATRGTTMKQPRPISGISVSSRKSYVPKSAAKGFLRSTSGRMSENRHSLMEDGDGGTVCLSEEQQKEWDKLKLLMDAMDRRHDVGVVGMLRELEDDEDGEDRRMFSNAQALAALEFGTAR